MTDVLDIKGYQGEGTQEAIKNMVATNDVVLFMKGSKHAPMCGFSSFVVQVLVQLGVDFFDVDVLEFQEMRDGVKSFTNWSTIPQLFIKGTFIGGCDITKQMHASGELRQILENAKIIKKKEEKLENGDES